MGTARLETLMDYAALKVDIAVRCRLCRHSRTMRYEQMGAIFGAATRIASIERRLRCSRCNQKGARLAPVPRLS